MRYATCSLEPSLISCLGQEDPAELVNQFRGVQGALFPWCLEWPVVRFGSAVQELDD